MERVGGTRRRPGEGGGLAGPPPGRPKSRNVQTRARARGAEGTGLLPARLRVSAARRPSTRDEAPRRQNGSRRPAQRPDPAGPTANSKSAPVSRGQGGSRCIPAGCAPAGSFRCWVVRAGRDHPRAELSTIATLRGNVQRKGRGAPLPAGASLRRDGPGGCSTARARQAVGLATVPGRRRRARTRTAPRR